MRTAAKLLHTAAAIWLAVAIGANELVLPRLLPSDALHDFTVPALRRSQLALAALAVSSAGAAWVLSRLGERGADDGGAPGAQRTRTRSMEPLGSKVLLAALVVFVPLSLGELLLRPFTPLVATEKTTLFLRDDELGWRLRPGAEGELGGAAVRVNAKGLRGRDIDYARTEGARRVLYLGDSVTFGFGVAGDERLFTHLAERALEEKLEVPVETVNAAVGGYSPWQQLTYLKREGLRYQPDLVVVGFVLNDVVSKFELRRFGGTGEGHQLAITSTSPWLDRLSEVSSVALRLRALGTRLRYGQDVAAGAAEEEALRVTALMTEPQSERVRAAWDMTLANLGEIFDLCEAEGVPAVLVVFPYAFQFTRTREGWRRTAAPQRVLTAFANERGVPVLDLMPPLDDERTRTGVDVRTWFFDENHLSSRGHEIVAEAVFEFLLPHLSAEGWGGARDGGR